MSNGFGFNAPGVQPAPDPHMVGQQLVQRGQQMQPHMGAMPPQPMQPPMSPADRDKMLRSEGGKLMGSGGDDTDAAFSQAVGEALTRAGGGHTANPNPHKDRGRGVRQLMQLGISEFEAGLLGETL